MKKREQKKIIFKQLLIAAIKDEYSDAKKGVKRYEQFGKAKSS